MAWSTYEGGYSQLVLSSKDVPRNIDNMNQTRAFMNLCFEIYYQGYQLTEDFEAGRKRLEKAASGTKGFGGARWWGNLYNLSDIMEYIENRETKGQNPKWDITDDLVRFRPPPSLHINQEVWVHEGFADFMRQVQDGAKKHIKPEYDRMPERLRDAQRAHQTGDWNSLRDVMSKVHDKAQLARSWMWLAPGKVQWLDKPLASIASYTETIGHVHKGLTAIADLTVGGNKAVHAAQLVGEAIETFIPVLGGYYGEAIQTAISVVLGFEELINNRVHIMDFAGNDSDYRVWRKDSIRD